MHIDTHIAPLHRPIARVLSMALLLAPLGTAALAQLANTENTLALAPDTEPVAAQLEDLSWLTGTWSGEGLGGVVQEVWAEPFADTVMGMFKAVRDGEIQFYEFVVIRPAGDSLVFEIKHFARDLVGWEEKDETVRFPLVRLGDDEVYFSGLTYRRVGPDELHAFVAVSREGSISEAKFVYHRVGT